MRASSSLPVCEKTIAVNRATEHLAEVMMDAALKGALGSRRAVEILEEPK